MPFCYLQNGTKGKLPFSYKNSLTITLMYVCIPKNVIVIHNGCKGTKDNANFLFQKEEGMAPSDRLK